MASPKNMTAYEYDMKKKSYSTVCVMRWNFTEAGGKLDVPQSIVYGMQHTYFIRKIRRCESARARVVSSHLLLHLSVHVSAPASRGRSRGCGKNKTELRR